MFNKIITLVFTVFISGYTVAAEQVITTQPLTQSAGASQAISFDVIYSTANPVDETLTGLGLRLHWNSSALTFNNVSNVLATNLFVTGAPQLDNLNLDGDANTDLFVNVSWADFGGNWPGVGNTPATLYKANFTTNNNFNANTTVNFSASSNAAGYVLDATSTVISSSAAVAPVNVPTLSFWSLLMLTALVGIFGVNKRKTKVL